MIPRSLTRTGSWPLRFSVVLRHCCLELLFFLGIEERLETVVAKESERVLLVGDDRRCGFVQQCTGQ